MRKLKCFIDLNKEEKWLGEMALRGWALEDVGFGYKFRPAKPEKADIKIDFRTFSNEADFMDYRTMFEDSGWMHIAGKKYSGTQYFKKIPFVGRDDIFSDAASKAGRFKRMADMWLSLAAAFLPFLIIFIATNRIRLEAFMSPASLYYTPGLWEKTGDAFWKAFLFETPFALLRGFAWLVIPFFIVLYLVFALKARKLYAKTKTDSNA